MSIQVRQATLSDYRALCALLEELDAFHCRSRPELFRPFDGPARTWEQVGKWLAGPDSTVLVAEDVAEVIGLAVLLPRPPSAFAGAAPRKVVVLDNLVVRADRRDRGIEAGGGIDGMGARTGRQPCRTGCPCRQSSRAQVLRASWLRRVRALAESGGVIKKSESALFPLQ